MATALRCGDTKMTEGKEECDTLHKDCPEDYACNAMCGCEMRNESGMCGVLDNDEVYENRDPPRLRGPEDDFCTSGRK